MESFGALLSSLRGSRLSQADLAVHAATSQSYVSRIESGAVQPTITQAERLLHCLGYQLRIEVDPLPGRSDQAGLPDQLAMNAEERMQSAAALFNTMTALRGGVSNG